MGGGWDNAGSNFYPYQQQWRANDFVQCATCGQWYQGAHYCIGTIGTTPYQPPIQPGVQPIPNPLIPIEEPQEEAEVKTCPRCEQETDKWDDDDYICQECRYG